MSLVPARTAARGLAVSLLLLMPLAACGGSDDVAETASSASSAGRCC